MSTSRYKYHVGHKFSKGRYGTEKLEWRKIFGNVIVEVWSQSAKPSRTYEIIPFYSDGERGEICPEYTSLEEAIKNAEQIFS